MSRPSHPLADALAPILSGLTAVQDDPDPWNRAWSMVYGYALPVLVAYCTPLLRGLPQDAEEVAHETLASVERSAHLPVLVGDAEAFVAFLFRSARNRCIDRLRRQQRHGARAVGEDHLDHVHDAADQTGMVGVQSVQELAALLERRGERLTPSDQLLLQGLVEGRPTDELAEQLGLTANAVNVRVFRLRQKLRKSLKELGLH